MFTFLYAPATADDNLLRIYLESRERYESHQNPTFNSAAGKNREDLLSRLRIGAELSLGPLWSAKAEYQNVSDIFSTQARNASTDGSDASLAYLKYTSMNLSVTGGRQKIDLGQQRLIGSAEWLNP